jgi:hypothetical protein
LLATSEVALRRYYIPPAMVARILRAADPVRQLTMRLPNGLSPRKDVLQGCKCG